MFKKCINYLTKIINLEAKNGPVGWNGLRWINVYLYLCWFAGNAARGSFVCIPDSENLCTNLFMDKVNKIVATSQCEWSKVEKKKT